MNLMDIPPGPLTVLMNLHQRFSKYHEELYLVGGSVRDLLMNRPEIADYDLATSALPEVTAEILRAAQPDTMYTIGQKFGTIGASFDGTKIEVTTFRTEHYEFGDRHPEVEFATTLHDDLSRRDLTINSMALNLEDGSVADPFGGMHDLAIKVIRMTGSARQRYLEDPLRLMRTVRFAVQFGFTLADGLAEEIRSSAPLLSQISNERIRDELNKILISPQPGRGLRMLVDLELAHWFCPDLVDLKKINAPEGASTNESGSARVGPNIPMKNLFEHVIGVLNNTPPDLTLRLAALFHDIAKPRTFSFSDGQVHFFGHDSVGARMTRKILTGLRYDQKTIELVSNLVGFHMRQVTNTDEWSERAVRRYVHTIGVETLPLLWELASADNTSTNLNRVRSHRARLARLSARCEQLLEEEGRDKIVSPLDGNELMALTGRKPGQWIAEVKEHLLNLVLDGELGRYDKEAATVAVHDFLDK